MKISIEWWKTKRSLFQLLWLTLLILFLNFVGVFSRCARAKVVLQTEKKKHEHIFLLLLTIWCKRMNYASFSYRFFGSNKKKIRKKVFRNFLISLWMWWQACTRGITRKMIWSEKISDSFITISHCIRFSHYTLKYLLMKCEKFRYKINTSERKKQKKKQKPKWDS